MATATIRPNATIYGGGTLIGGAGSTHATLADDSDGTYASKAAGSPADHVRFGTTTKPAGSILSTIRPWMKLQSPSGTTKADFYVPQWGPAAVYGLSVSTTPTIYYGPVCPVGDQAQAFIDGLEMAYRTPSGSNTRFLEAGIDLVFPEPPTCAITAPTGTVTTSDVAVAWTHTPGTDGAGQSAYRIKVFTAAQFGDPEFDQGTSEAYYFSGTVSTGSASTTVILGAGVFRVYVRTAQSIAGMLQWSDWDYEQITVSLTTAEVLEVTAAANAADGSVEIIVDRNTANDPWDHVELLRQSFTNLLGDYGKFETEGSTPTPGLADGWTEIAYASPAAATSFALDDVDGIDGQYQVLNATVDDGEIFKSGFATDCVGGDLMGFSAWVNSDLGANAAARLSLVFSTNPSHDAQDIADNAVAVAVVDDAIEGVWHPVAVAVSAPTGARRCLAQHEVVGLTGASGAVCSVKFDTAHFTRNWGGGVAVRGATDVTPGTNQVTFFDYEAPPDMDLSYVARAVKDDGTVGEWVYSAEDISWTLERGVWVKSIDDPTRNTLLRLVEAPEPVTPWRGVDIEIDGDPYPVTVTGTRGARRQTFIFRTNTETEADRLVALCDADIVVIHAPGTVRVAPGYWSLKDLKEQPMVRYGAFPYREWSVQAVEVAAP
jgi:hypothetical protein